MLISIVLPLFPFKMRGIYHIQDVVNIILLACCQGGSIEQAANSVKKGPSAQDVRHHLREKLTLRDVELKMNDLLLKFVECLPKNRPLTFAVDFVHVQYYGKPKRKNGREIRRAKRKAGTTRFHAYATLYVVLYGHRFTLAARYVRPKETVVHVLDGFLDVIKNHGLKVERLLLDKGFYNHRVIRELTRRRIPAIIPMPRSKMGTGNSYLFHGRKSYRTTYTLASSKKKAAWKIRFPVYVVVTYLKGKNEKHGAVHLAYVVLNNAATLDNVRTLYRSRFGIESSYRLMNVCRARTTSRDPAVRLMFVVVSLVIQNVWIYTKWTYVNRPRQKVREVLDRILPLRLFVHLVEGYLFKRYGRVDSIVSVSAFHEPWGMKRIPKSLSQRCPL